MKGSLFAKRWPWLTAASIFALVAVSSQLVLRQAENAGRPIGTAEDIEAIASRTDVNLLFILIDTLRASRLGCYGYERETSPLLDHVASGGVRFAHHLSQSSWTKCSMASMWSGLYPQRTRITRFDHVIPDAATLPAEIFLEAGFRTTALYRNGWVAPYFGFSQGFEVYERPISRPGPATLQRANPTVSTGGTDDDVIPASLEFLRIHGRERWLLYLHLMDIHEYVYDADTAKFGSAHSDIYDNAILRTNLVLDNLLGALDEAGHLENTVVVFAADHGEAFSERGIEGHARFVYPETTEVPFIIHFPFRLEPGVVVENRTQNVDIWPTLLDLFGLPPMPDTDGQSRVPEILSAARGQPQGEDSQQAFAHLDTTWGQRDTDPAPTIAVAEGDRRFVMVPQRGRVGTIEQLFDRSADPSETTPFNEDEPELVERLRSSVQSYLEAPAPPWGDEADSLEMSEMQLNQLRALGYEVP